MKSLFGIRKPICKKKKNLKKRIYFEVKRLNTFKKDILVMFFKVKISLSLSLSLSLYLYIYIYIYTDRYIDRYRYIDI